MSEMKDLAIKLFGKTIPILEVDLNREVVLCDVSVTSSSSASDSAAKDCCDHNPINSSFHEEDRLCKEEEQTSDKELSGKGVVEDKQEVGTSQESTEDSRDPTASSGISENPKTPPADRETSSLRSCKNGEQSDTSVSQEKTPKKPDKILVCPRCNSMETKFCYYNNYNVNQPRHFCKNCQRYWTAGGTMRNVPVGAGRRKNKSSSASQYRQLIVSEALRTAAAEANAGNNGIVLTFGSDSPLCETVASVLNLCEKSKNSAQNGYHKRSLPGCGGKDNGDDHSSGSSITASSSSEKGGGSGRLQESAMVKNYQGFPPRVSSIPGSSWPYPWNSAQWNSAVPPPPVFSPSGFPVTFFPAPPYWGCTVPPPWNVPCLSSTCSSLDNSTQNSNPTSPNLGKHSREGNILSPTKAQKDKPSKDNIDREEKSFSVPKTLRIDDPSEAARSSVWSTIGLRSEKLSSTNRVGLFDGFQSKSGNTISAAQTSLVLQANPAALSRSVKFRGST